MEHAAGGTTLLLALILATAVQATRPQRVTVQHDTILEGKAIIIEGDLEGLDTGRILAVRTPSGRHVQVSYSDDSQLAGVTTGMSIEVTGQWQQPSGTAAGPAAASGSASAAPSTPSATAFQASSIRAWGAAAAPKPKLVVSPVAGHRPAAAAAIVRQLPSGITLSTNPVLSPQLSTIVIPIAGVMANGAACPGTTAQPAGIVNAVRAAVFEEGSPAGQVTVGSTFNKCSHGRTKLTRNNSLVVDTVQLPCSGSSYDIPWSFSTCNFDDFSGWSDAASEALAARGIDMARYKYKVFLVPPGVCNFVGLAYVGCDETVGVECRSWIGPSYWTSAQAISHEIGHNLYMMHAGAYYGDVLDEYNDDTDMMGYCCDNRCTNTAHAWQLGWISAQQFDGTNLKPGTTAVATLMSQAVSARSGVRVELTWAPGQPPIYLGFRTAVHGDVQLPARLARQVHIYSSSISSNIDPQPTLHHTSLGAGGNWTFHPASLVVRVRRVLADRAVVSVCRKGGLETLASCRAGIDMDCNGLVGDKDPRCQMLFRRAIARTQAAT